MKRGTITHHKTDRLAKVLGIGRWGAVGILESLWHATAERTPQGDIGHLTDKEIGYYIGWDGDCSLLVNALVECGWLDRCDVHRLLVHDWHDHADDATKKRLARNGIGFLTGHVRSCPDNGGQRRTTADTSDLGSGHIRLPEPVPEPQPVPGPEPSQGHSGPSFLAFWNAYPRKGRTRQDHCIEVWNRIRSEGIDMAAVVSGAAEYAESHQGQHYTLSAPKWLDGKCWMDDRAAWSSRDEQAVKKPRRDYAKLAREVDGGD